MLSLTAEITRMDLKEPGTGTRDPGEAALNSPRTHQTSCDHMKHAGEWHMQT